MPFPSPPWHLQGTFWLSVFVVVRGTSDRPPGLYGAAFVDYTDDGDLGYRELLVARLTNDGPLPRVTVTDIWVDSEASRAGGRALWAIPKGLADLEIAERRRSPVSRSTTASATPLDPPVAPTAKASFTAAGTSGLRTPIRFGITQRRPDGQVVKATVRGSCRIAPAVGRWEFAPDGPLGWLGRRVPRVSARLDAARLVIG